MGSHAANSKGATKSWVEWVDAALKVLVDKAIGGDLDAAELALKILARAERYGDPGIDLVLVENWMAGYPGQTANQKTADFAAGRDATPGEWWSSSEIDRKKFRDVRSIDSPRGSHFARLFRSRERAIRLARPSSLLIDFAAHEMTLLIEIVVDLSAAGRLMHAGAVRVLAGCNGQGKGSGKLERSAHHGRNEPGALPRLSDAGPQGRMAVTIPRSSVFPA
jgi:hypothetical protein